MSHHSCMSPYCPECLNGYVPSAPPPPPPAPPPMEVPDPRTIPTDTLAAHPTGSRYTCTPAVLDTDDDWLVLVPNLDKAGDELLAQGFEACLGLSDPYEIEKQLWRFRAFRRGSLNLIVTDQREKYLQSVAATLLCAKLNLTDKDDRIELFRAIRFNHDQYTGPLP